MPAAPGMANVIAGAILSTLLALGGTALIVFSLHAAYVANWHLPLNTNFGWSWLAVGGLSLIGVLLLVCGVLLGRFTRGLRSRRVALCENGFRYRTRGRVEDVLWTDVSGVREEISQERAPILKGPAKLLIPVTESTNYVVVTRSGKKYSFDGNSVREIEQFRKRLLAESIRRSFSCPRPWVVASAPSFSVAHGFSRGIAAHPNQFSQSLAHLPESECPAMREDSLPMPVSAAALSHAASREALQAER